MKDLNYYNGIITCIIARTIPDQRFIEELKKYRFVDDLTIKKRIKVGNYFETYITKKQD